MGGPSRVQGLGAGVPEVRIEGFRFQGFRGLPFHISMYIYIYVYLYLYISIYIYMRSPYLRMHLYVVGSLVRESRALGFKSFQGFSVRVPVEFLRSLQGFEGV